MKTWHHAETIDEQTETSAVKSRGNNSHKIFTRDRRQQNKLSLHTNRLSDLPARARQPLEYSDSKNTNDSLSERINQKVGPYQILRILDQGGMGSVYLAERTDREFNKKVAIKILHTSLATADMLKRFVAERQILAQLEHPNIARLLDGGATSDGLPYLVMEYVEGLPIDIYCEQHALSVKHRLKLFQSVCSAVSYTHRNLIIHRDLKPNNIIVTPNGVPKLLDFGIAKLLNSEILGKQASETVTLLHIFTPDYASPEQIRGLPVSTASDVYSLGVLLYQLLTGHLPFQSDDTRPSEIERAVCETMPTKPSLVVNNPNLRIKSNWRWLPENFLSSKFQWRKQHRQILGDLDNIVLMSMRKEPTKRYSSVEQFSADIDRCLNRQPVKARPITWRYSGLRFVQRNLASIVLVSMLFVLIITLAWTSLTHTVRVAQERDLTNTAQLKSEQERANLKAVNGFLHEMLTTVYSPEKNTQDITVRALLDQTANRLKSNNTIPLKPAVVANIRKTLGQTYSALSLYAKAENELRLARDYYLEHTAETNTDNVHTSLALVKVLTKLDQKAEALEIAETTYRSCIANLGEQDRLTMEAAHQLATIFYRAEKFDRAVSLSSKVLNHARLMLQDSDPLLLKTLRTNAFYQRVAGNLDRAEELMNELYFLNEKTNGYMHPNTADILTEMARLSSVQGELDKSISQFKRAKTISDKVLGVDHVQSIMTSMDLASVYGQSNKSELALELYQDSLKTLKQKFQPNHRLILLGTINLGITQTKLENFDQAEKLFNQLIQTIDQNDHRQMYAVTLANLGELYIEMQQYTQAKIHLEKSVDILTELRGSEHHYTTLSRHSLARAEQLLGNFSESKQHFEISITSLEKIFPPEHPSLQSLYRDYSDLLNTMGLEQQAKTITTRLVAKEP